MCEYLGLQIIIFIPSSILLVNASELKNAIELPQLPEPAAASASVTITLLGTGNF